MLRFVASGPFPGATDMGSCGRDPRPRRPFRADGDHGRPSSSLVVHATARAARQAVAVGARSTALVTYFAMNWLVVPLRFPRRLPPKTLSIATQLFAHLVAWSACRTALLRQRSMLRGSIHSLANSSHYRYIALHDRMRLQPHHRERSPQGGARRMRARPRRPTPASAAKCSAGAASIMRRRSSTRSAASARACGSSPDLTIDA